MLCTVAAAKLYIERKSHPFSNYCVDLHHTFTLLLLCEPKDTVRKKGR